MQQAEPYRETALMYYLETIWKRRWLIVVPAFFLAAAAGIGSLLVHKTWEVDAIFQPSKFFIQTEQGQFQEVFVVDPGQVAGQINQSSYNDLLASELSIPLQEFPDIEAENLRNTKLVRVWVREKDPEKGRRILTLLFQHLKRDFDKKVDVEIKTIDTEIAKNENEIKQNELAIKDKWSEIKLLDIQKAKTAEGIATDANKLKISEDRYQSITGEMKSAKNRIDEIEDQMRRSLAEKRQEGDAVGLLLYANEVQNNLRYYNTLEEKSSAEKITQESLKLAVQEKREDIRQLDTQVEKLKIEIEKTRNAGENFKNQITLLGDRKLRIDSAQFVKEPTRSHKPVAPKPALNVLVAGFLGLGFFFCFSFFLEYIESHKKHGN